jgi:hypothetical protein
VIRKSYDRLRSCILFHSRVVSVIQKPAAGSPGYAVAPLYRRNDGCLLNNIAKIDRVRPENVTSAANNLDRRKDFLMNDQQTALQQDEEAALRYEVSDAELELEAAAGFGRTYTSQTSASRKCC